MSEEISSKRVLIIDKKHGWYGFTGTLTDEELTNMPGMYRVNLDNGMSAGCYVTQLKVL